MTEARRKQKNTSERGAFQGYEKLWKIFGIAVCCLAAGLMAHLRSLVLASLVDNQIVSFGNASKDIPERMCAFFVRITEAERKLSKELFQRASEPLERHV